MLTVEQPIVEIRIKNRTFVMVATKTVARLLENIRGVLLVLFFA